MFRKLHLEAQGVEDKYIPIKFCPNLFPEAFQDEVLALSKYLDLA